MNISIAAKENDDTQFIKIVNQVLTRLLKQDAPQEAFVIRIDRWFDHKWLNFSGIGRVYFDNALRVGGADVALDDFHQDKITFPPFNPNRVLEEYHFFQVGGKEYFESVPDKFIHRSKPTNSGTNLHKRVADFTKSGVFVWFNSQTQNSGQGSLMIYKVLHDEVQTWFVSLERSKEWKLTQVKGITREQVLTLIV